MEKAPLFLLRSHQGGRVLSYCPGYLVKTIAFPYGNESKWENENKLRCPCHNCEMAQDTMKVVIEEGLKRRFKVACTERDLTMSDVVSALVEGWLEGRFPVLQDEANGGTEQQGS